MRFLLTVAWRNLWRHARRSVITAGAMGVGVALCMAMIAYTDGMYAKIFDVMVTQNLGHVQVHAPGYPGKRLLHETLPEAGALVEELDALPGVAGVSPRAFGYAFVGGAETSTGARLTGVLPEREIAVVDMGERVDEGRWLGSEAANEAVLGAELAKTLELGIGDELIVVTQAVDGSLGNDLYTVVGLARTGSAQMDRAGAWLHLADLQELLALPGQAHELVLIADDVEDADAIAAETRRRAGDRDVLVRTWAEADPQAAQMMGMQDVGAGIMLTIVFSVAALGVLNTMLMAVFERTRELGVLRALGLTPSQLVGMVILESVFLAGLAAVAGGLLGGLLDWLLVTRGVTLGGDQALEVEGVRFESVVHGIVRPEGVALTLGALVLVCVLASIWPAIRAARLRPVDAMRQV